MSCDEASTTGSTSAGGAVDGAAVEARLLADVHALCSLGPRPVGSPAHRGARSYLTRRFHGIGLSGYANGGHELAYEERGQTFVNLVGVAPGTDPERAPVLVGAHYDTVPSTPGADDNAAAIAIALEVAARLVERPAARPVVIAHFDAEEPPYFHSRAMGSVQFVAEQMRRRPHAALVLDLVGHAIAVPGLEEVLSVMGTESHPELAAAVAARASAHLPLLTLPNRFMPDMSDHYPFRVAGIPYLFLSCGQWEHYHRPSDTPERLDVAKMARTADLLEALVRDVSDREMDGAVEHDTLALDTRHLQRLLGPTAAALGLGGEEDFHRVVWRLVAAIQGW
jgi:hypothetical protein